MRRRFYSSLIALLLIFMIVWTAFPALAQARSVYWLNWDVHIDQVDMAENRFHVVETHDVQFTGGFSYGSRVIEHNRLDTIEGIRVYEDGDLLYASCSGNIGTFCVRLVSNGWEITYYFKEPIISKRQVFQIEYDVVGALRSYEGGDQLWWMAIPYDTYGYAIASSRITLELPAGYAPRAEIDPVETYGADGTAYVEGNQVIAHSLGSISGKENFELRVQFPHNPNGRTPEWQSSFDSQREFEENVMPFVNIGLIGAGGLLALAGPLGMLTLWRRKGRDPEIGPVPEYLSEPPSDLHPAVVGTLIDEQADTHDIIAILVALAHKGYIVMEETRSEGLFGIGASRKYIFKRTDKKNDTGLSGFESRFMREMFSGGRMERSLDSMKEKFYRAIPKLKSDLYNELVKEGFMKSSPELVRNAWTIIGVLMLGLAGAAFVFLMMLAEESSAAFNFAFLCVPIGLAVSGIVTTFVGRHMPAKTQRGAEETAKWNAFKTYLANLDSYTSVEAAADRFDQYLPYAVAFGLDRSWVNRFAKIDHMPIPTWYYPTYLDGPYRGGYRAGTPLSTGNIGGLAQASGGGFSLDSASGNLAGGLQSMSDGLTNMLSSASSAMTSQPSSSGGGGWSGGGFSGGGSSGGGSAGFG